MGAFLGAIWSDVRRHWKGYILIGVTEFVLIRWLQDLRAIAGDPLVQNGLHNGKVVTCPIRPGIFPWPHLVFTRGNMPMDKMYMADSLRFMFLSLGKNLTAITLIASIPIIIYFVCRAVEHVARRQRTRFHVF